MTPARHPARAARQIFDEGVAATATIVAQKRVQTQLAEASRCERAKHARRAT